MLNQTKYIPAFWYSSNNFGDALTHYLIKKISGKTPILVDKDDPCDKAMVTGSILNNEVTNAFVWGCGVAFKHETMPTHKKILAVRGRLSGELLKSFDIPFDEVYGDPCLLLPRLYNPEVSKKYKIGILPHYIDTKLVYEKLGHTEAQLNQLGIRVIDIMDDVESVVRAVKSCTKIVSSTLHGIIVSHAYGIPCEWVKFSDNIIGDDIKYHDYYSSINFVKNSFMDLRGDLTVNMLNVISDFDMVVPKMDIDLDALYNCCPFKL